MMVMFIVGLNATEETKDSLHQYVRQAPTRLWEEEGRRQPRCRCGPLFEG